MNRNGIDLEVLGALEQQLTTTPDLGAVTVDTGHRWVGTYAVEGSTRQIGFAGQAIPRTHRVRADLLEAFGGADTGPTPGELVLSALAACITQRFVEQAAVAQIEVHAVDVSCRGYLDLRGVLGHDGVRPGMTRIDIEVEARTAADDGTVRGLVDEAVRTSPTADTLVNGVELRPRVRAQSVGEPA